MKKLIGLVLLVGFLVGCEFLSPPKFKTGPTLEQVAAPYVARYGEPTAIIRHTFYDSELAIYEWYDIVMHIGTPNYYTFDNYHDTRFATDRYHDGWYVVKP